MNVLFVLLFLFSLGSLVIGIIAPRFTPLLRRKSRSQVAKVYGIATVASFFLVGVTAPKPTEPVQPPQANLFVERSTPTPITSPTPTPTASASPPLQSSEFRFPQASCGDPPTGTNDTWYPVFIDAGDLETIRQTYCADAIATVREKTGKPAVQLGSFTNREKAERFAQAVKGELGEPTLPVQSELLC